MAQNTFIYLDYAATTPLDPLVKERIVALPQLLGNANSIHAFSDTSRKLVANAAQELASLINVPSKSIIWTSGATEANNLAILGAARFYQHSGRHVICASIEHDSVLEPFKQLAREGFEVTYLKPDKEGLITVSCLKAALRRDTLLVSVAGVNGELGTIQPLQELTQAAHEVGALVHSDLTMALGKMPLDLTASGVDLATFSAHKIYGPQGVGALYRRMQPHKIHLAKIMFGGLQQDNMRPGSLPVPLIVGMGAACARLLENRDELAHLKRLDKVLTERLAAIPGLIFNGPKSLDRRVPGLINFTITGGDMNTGLLKLVPSLAMAYSAACHWDCRSSEPPVSKVLSEIGVPERLLKRSVRLSIGRFTTPQELDIAVTQLADLGKKLINKA